MSRSIALRCRRYRHAVYHLDDGDPGAVTGYLEVRCGHCDRVDGAKQLHVWRLVDIVAAIGRGERECRPSSPPQSPKQAA